MSGKRCDVKLLEPADDRHLVNFYCQSRCVVFSQQVHHGSDWYRIRCPGCPWHGHDPEDIDTNKADTKE